MAENRDIESLSALNIVYFFYSRLPFIHFSDKIPKLTAVPNTMANIPVIIPIITSKDDKEVSWVINQIKTVINRAKPNIILTIAVLPSKPFRMKKNENKSA